MRKEHLEDLSKDLDELDQLGVRINSTVVKVVKTNQKEDVGRAHAQRLPSADHAVPGYEATAQCLAEAREVHSFLVDRLRLALRDRIIKI